MALKKAKDLGLGKTTPKKKVKTLVESEVPEAVLAQGRFNLNKSLQPSINLKKAPLLQRPTPGKRNSYAKAYSEEEELKRLIEIETIPRQGFSNRVKRLARDKKKL